MGPRDQNTLDIFDPELENTEYSEISAAVDLSAHGTDKVFRPVYINQDDQILALTPEDAKRLLKFLRKAVKAIDSFQTRSLQ